MKPAGYVLLGVLIGVFVDREFMFPAKNKVNDESVSEETPLKVSDSTVVSHLYKRDSAVPVQPPNQASGDQAKLQMLSTQRGKVISGPDSAMNSASNPKKLELTFSEETVAELESNLRDLPSQIHLNQENEGLRVNYLSENSIFKRVGLNTGDLIRYEILNNLKASKGDQNQLANRLARIIDYVR